MKHGDTRGGLHSPDLEELRRRIDDLKSGHAPEPEELHSALVEVLQARTETSALLESARAILKHREFESAARAIFDACKQITGATAGYVALLSEDGSENEVLFLDAGGLPCAVDPSLPMPIRGPQAEAYRGGKTVYDNDFSGSDWMKFMPEGHVDLRNVLFAPLNLEGETVGLMGLANKPGDFTEDDARIASLLGEFAAIALKNSKYLDSLYKASDVMQRKIFECKQAEAALRESEEQFRRVYEQSPIGIEVYDTEGCLLEVNNACLDIFGVVESSELFGFKLFEDANLPDEEKGRLRTGETVRYDTSFDFEKVKENGLYRTAKNGLIHLDVLITPLKPDKKAAPVGYMVQVQDITARRRAQEALKEAHDRLERRVEERTKELAGANENLQREIEERKKTEEALFESEARFRRLFENAPLGYQSLDEHGDFIEVNQAWLDTLGYSREEVIDHNLSEFLAPDWKDRFKENFPRFKAEGEIIGVEFEMIRKDGARKTIQFNGRIGYDEHGNFKQTHCIMHDITEKKRAEDALRESEARWRSLTENSPDYIALLDRDANIVFMNHAIPGTSPEEVIGRSAYDFFPEKYWPAMKESYDYVMRTGEPSQHEAVYRDADGIDHTFEAFVGPILVDGEVTALVVSGRNITGRIRAEEERKKLEAQLQHAQKLESLGVLAGGIAHDFNNLLTGILGNAQLGKLNLPPTSPALRNIEEIEKATQRAADLSNQMLAYSGQGRFRIEKISLNEIVKEMGHLLEVSISKKITLQYNFDGNLPAIKVDVTQIRQVIMNLITNASEAIGDETGAIAVTTGAMECDSTDLANTYLTEQLQPGEYVYLEVTDTGCGMDEEALTKLFDPFFTTKFTGRGLGLAATLGIVRGHKGAIKVKSEPNVGSTFRIMFPAAEKTRETETIEPAEPKPTQWRGHGAVLLVDDEETVRGVVEAMLKSLGFTVLKASDGVEAVEVFRERCDEISMVLLDLTMPRMNGAEAFDEIRRIRPDTRVVLSSGFGAQKAMDHFEGKGLSGFIQKPYTYDALAKMMRQAIDG